MDGFIMQKTNFPFEILIHDDASTDATASIIKEYEKKYPDIIRAVYQAENQYSKGINPGIEHLFPNAKGKYIALCEGDDYWTDPYKLQKQVDFLETHLEHNLCSHRFKIYDEDLKGWAEAIPQPLMPDSANGVEFDFRKMLEVWHAQTMTMLFRRDALDSFDMLQYPNFCDFHLCYHLLKGKKGYCLNIDAAVYRLHGGGVFSKQSIESKTYLSYYIIKNLYIHNQNDSVVANNFYANRKDFFENYLRLTIYKKKESKIFLREASLYLKEEYASNGFIDVFLSLRKMLLSFIKSWKRKS